MTQLYTISYSEPIGWYTANKYYRRSQLFTDTEKNINETIIKRVGELYKKVNKDQTSFQRRKLREIDYRGLLLSVKRSKQTRHWDCTVGIPLEGRAKQ